MGCPICGVLFEIFFAILNGSACARLGSQTKMSHQSQLNPMMIYGALEVEKPMNTVSSGMNSIKTRQWVHGSC